MSLVAHVALVSESDTVDFSELARAGAEIQKQVVRDLELLWDVRATVNAFASLEDVPPGYWPIILKDDIELDAAGIHCDRERQPIALVTAEPAWSLTASHEALEMLTDPFGNRERQRITSRCVKSAPMLARTTAGWYGSTARPADVDLRPHPDARDGVMGPSWGNGRARPLLL